ncbi:hypothetical protein [Methylobacterium komagatae]
MSKPRDRLYWIWSDMHQRCRNPNHRQFADYGGRGVTVCDRWTSFLAFEEDMGHRPDGRSLDRRDNALGYSPQNCRWATRKEQNSNRRNCIIVSCDGEDVTLAEYCRRKNMPYRPVVKRIQDRGWPVQLAITAPIGSRLRRIVA